MIVAYLSDDELRVVEGSGGLPTTVETVHRLQNLKGSVKGGIVVDQATFKTCVGEFWEDNRIETKGIKVILESQHLALLTLSIPLFKKEQDQRTYIFNELSSMGRITDPLFDYQTISVDKAERKCTILASAIENSVITHIIDCFSALGISVISVTNPYETIVSCFKELHRKPLKGTTLYITANHDKFIAVLLQDGVYRYSSEQHLFNEYGTHGFAKELLRGINGLEQFIHAEHIADKLDRIFLCGLDEAASKICEEEIRAFDATADVAEIPLSTFFKSSVTIGEDFFLENFPLIAALNSTKSGVGLVEAWKVHTGANITVANKVRSIEAFIAPLAALIVCLIIVAIFVNWNMTEQNTIDSANQVLEVPQAQQRLAAVTAAQKKQAEAQKEVESARKLKQSIGTYPQPGADVEKTVASCAKGIVSYAPSSYDATTGRYIVTATSKNPDKIHRFVSNLIATKAFEVYYNGYNYQKVTATNGSTTGTWKLDITLTLPAGKGAE